MSNNNFRISFQVVAFTRGAPVSPQRIEERIFELLGKIVFDDIDSAVLDRGEVFGYVSNMSVTRNDG